MENTKTDKQSRLLLIGFFSILLGVLVISIKYVFYIKNDYIEEKYIEKFYKEQEEIKQNTDTSKTKLSVDNKSQKNNSYIAMLKIPKINLERGLLSVNSSHNNVNENVQILKESDFPDKEYGNFILASHSGTGKTAYFKNLNKLDIDDIVYVLYNGSEYKYKVVNFYDIEKTGEAHIVRNAEKTTLTLITCIARTNKQIIYICELI